MAKLLALFFLVTTAVGCATHQGRMSGPVQLIQSGQVSQAVEQLKPKAEAEGLDQVLYLMELGSAQQMMGLYKESNESFLKAERLAELKDYHSISQIGAAALGSEEMIQYKGENYENLLINIKMALNYLMLGDFENAMVQARRIDVKINALRLEGRPDFERNPFALYLAGILYEARGEQDNALILYQQAHELDPTMAMLPESIVGAAKWLRRNDVLETWKAKGVEPEWLSRVRNKDYGELVVINLVGWGPRKHFSRLDYRFPELRESSALTSQVVIELTKQGTEGANKTLQTLTAYDVNRAAIATYQADVAWMIARKVGAQFAKRAVIEELNRKDSALALVAGLAMTVADRADLRCWTLLPGQIQIQRVWLPVGDYHLRMQGFTFGQATGEQSEPQSITIRSGRKAFAFWRPLK